MKKKLLFIFTIIGSVLFMACDSDDDEKDPKPETSTETTAEFDNTSFGLYKGVVVGSSGTIKVTFNNGNSEVKAYLKIDGRNEELTYKSTFSKDEDIKDAIFTSNTSSITFNVDKNGKNPEISSITIEGHEDVSAVILKETSNAIAYCYEGSYTGGNSEKGIFNCVRSGNNLSGISKGENGAYVSFKGSYNDGDVSISGKGMNDVTSFDFSATGTMDKDNTRGSWTTSWIFEGIPGTNTGTFSGKKTL